MARIPPKLSLLALSAPTTIPHRRVYQGPFLKAFEASRNTLRAHHPLAGTQRCFSSPSSPLPIPPSKLPKEKKDYRFERIGIPCEWAERYRPGGLHPVHFGDVFNDRYRVIRKLGYGGFGTVWLAVDSENDRYVALKIEISGRGDDQKELGIQRLLAERAPEDPCSKFVVKFLDSFHHEGPNGKHLCFVYEPMGSSLAEVYYTARDNDPFFDTDFSFPVDKTKRIIRHMLSGLHFLHSNGIVHGDLGQGNVMHGLQDLSAVGPETLKQEMRSEPDARARVDFLKRVDGKEDRWAPRYLAAADPLSDYNASEVIKLADLGSSFYINDHPQVKIESLNTPQGLRAPEILVSEIEKIGSGIDIWSVGCLLYEFLTGTRLFNIFEFTAKPKDDHLMLLNEVIGPLPEDIWAKWPGSSRFYGPNRERLDVWPFRREERDDVEYEDEEDEDFHEEPRAPPASHIDALETQFKAFRAEKATELKEGDRQIGEEEERQILSLIRSMLQYDPARRPSAAELLEHPWFNS